jgi:hypothetical protein
VGFLFFFSCTPASVPPPTDTFCTRYQPIRWSAADTRGTKEQVDKLNRRWKATCRKE